MALAENAYIVLPSPVFPLPFSGEAAINRNTRGMNMNVLASAKVFNYAPNFGIVVRNPFDRIYFISDISLVSYNI